MCLAVGEEGEVSFSTSWTTVMERLFFFEGEDGGIGGANDNAILDMTIGGEDNG